MTESSSPEDPRNTPFLAILAYVLGFMALLGLLAWAGACLMRRLLLSETEDCLRSEPFAGDNQDSRSP